MRYTQVRNDDPTVWLSVEHQFRTSSSASASPSSTLSSTTSRFEGIPSTTCAERFLSKSSISNIDAIHCPSLGVIRVGFYRSSVTLSFEHSQDAGIEHPCLAKDLYW